MNREDAKWLPLVPVAAAMTVYEQYLKPNPSLTAWCAIGASVVAYEAVAPEGHLLSEAVDRAIEKHPVITKGAIGLVALHLSNILPNKLDPIHQLTRLK